MNRTFSTIYLKLILVGGLIVAPAAALFLYNSNQRLNRLLDQQLQEQFRQVGRELVQAFPEASEIDAKFQAESMRIVSGLNSSGSVARVVQAGLYKKADAEGVFRLIQNVHIDKTSSIPILSTDVFKESDLMRLRQLDPIRFKFSIPIPNARAPDHVIFLQAVDATRPEYIHNALFQQGLFWAGTFIALLLCVALFVIHAEIKIPLKHLRAAFAQKRKTALDPEDFGEFADLVRSLEDFRQLRDETASDLFVDPSTGLPTELEAQKIYAEARQAKEECYIVFFKSNFAKEYIKAFGRANRGLIKKLAAEALEHAMGAKTPRAVTEDFFFVTVLKPKEFRGAVDKCQRHFNATILRLYELGQGKQVPIQTLSAFAVSNLAPDLDTCAKALDMIQKHWQDAVDPHRGGWAILTFDGRIENAKGMVEMADPTAQAEPVREERKVAGESADGQMDAVLARKMFIVKLSRTIGIKPRLAAQVYSAGWQRPDLLLQTKIQDLSSRAGMETEEAADLIANLRKIPREKLEYTQEDFREVFITDVRMLRKIARESIARWFDAGFRKVEDLRNVSTDDLIKIDEAVAKEDIEALLAGVRMTAAK